MAKEIFRAVSHLPAPDDVKTCMNEAREKNTVKRWVYSGPTCEVRVDQRRSAARPTVPTRAPRGMCSCPAAPVCGNADEVADGIAGGVVLCVEADVVGETRADVAALEAAARALEPASEMLAEAPARALETIAPTPAAGL